MTALVLYEAVVALAIAQRLAELVHSRRNQRRLAPGSHAADTRANWIALVAAQTAWIAGCALEPALRGTVAPRSAFVTGVALFLAGAALRTWCILRLGPAWNARARVDPGLRVVSSGPDRWIRHPNYLGVLLELVGLPLAGGAWWTLALTVPPHVYVLAQRIRGEDRLLYGVPGYAEAMAGKGALLPRLRR
jgi:methyltransferase